MTRFIAAIIFAVAIAIAVVGAALAQDEGTPTIGEGAYGSQADCEPDQQYDPSTGTCLHVDPLPTPDGGPIEGGPPTTPQVFGFYCEDFPSLADAQDALDAGVADPAKVDADGNGLACEGVEYENNGTMTLTLWECSNYPSQDAAQRALEGWYQDPNVDPYRNLIGNPDRIDPDGNGVACDHPNAYPDPTPTCDTVSQEDAQAYVDAHFGGIYAGNGGPLDPDGDGIACNHTGSSTVDEPTPVPSEDGGAAYVDAGAGDGEADAATVDEVVTEDPNADEPIATEPATDEGGAFVETSTGDDDTTSGGTGSVTLPKTGVGSTVRESSVAHIFEAIAISGAVGFAVVSVWIAIAYAIDRRGR